MATPWSEQLENQVSELARADINDNNCWLRAYANTLTIANSDVLATYEAAEANFNGYQAQSFTAPNASVTVPGVNAYFDPNQVTFQPGGGAEAVQLLGGFFATNNTNTRLIDVYPLNTAYNTVANTNFTVQVRRSERSQRRA